MLLLLASLVAAVHLHWNVPQSQFLQLHGTPHGPIEYVDFEGAVRAGKSTPAAAKLATYALEYPGIHLAAARWTQDNLDAQVKPLWRATARQFGLAPKWNPHEEFDELDNGSRIYLRALKSSEDAARYSKLAGLTLAVLWIDQPEEAPVDVIDAYVPARLSQVGYPHEVWYTPNPPSEDHWLAVQFPELGGAPHHTYIRTSVYDNRHNLGDAYIADLEAKFPVGSPLRRRFIEGKRGLSVVGKPVYAGYFVRDRHAVPVDLNPEVPLIECIDFGHHHPCAVWLQFLPWGALHVLGGVMGKDLFLEDFAPIVKTVRAEWFRRAKDVWACCDPAGTHQNSTGVAKTGLEVLRDNKIHPRWIEASNSPTMRDYALQTIAGYMRRRTPRGTEAFAVHPRRWRVVSATGDVPRAFGPDGFEAGYVWGPRPVRVGNRLMNVPLKDGNYEHAMNCTEYGVLNYGPAQPSQVDEEKLQRQAVARAQRDDPEDLLQRRGYGRGRGRGGY